MILIAIFSFIFLLMCVVQYNQLIRVKNNVDNAYGALDAALQQRYDMIPNLVAVIQQYSAYEKDTLEGVVKLRVRACDSGTISPDEKLKLDRELSTNLGKLMVNVESYPDLKASANFQHLQRSLNEVEAQIAASRRAYNATITEYNNAIQTFPGNMFASAMEMRPKNVLSIPQADRNNIDVRKHFQQ